MNAHLYEFLWFVTFPLIHITQERKRRILQGERGKRTEDVVKLGRVVTGFDIGFKEIYSPLANSKRRVSVSECLFEEAVCAYIINLFWKKEAILQVKNQS